MSELTQQILVGIGAFLGGFLLIFLPALIVHILTNPRPKGPPTPFLHDNAQLFTSINDALARIWDDSR